GPGGLSERIAVAPYKLFQVPQELTAEMVALTEPVACALRSVRRAKPHPGAFALVFGGGTMGLIHTILLTLEGCKVFLVDDDVATHGPACAAGARHVGPLDTLRGLDPINEFTDGWGFDLVFCTRFGAQAVHTGIRAAARGGRVVLYQSIVPTSPVSV